MNRNNFDHTDPNQTRSKGGRSTADTYDPGFSQDVGEDTNQNSRSRNDPRGQLNEDIDNSTFDGGDL